MSAYTRSPSEPVLALCAADILCGEAGRWALVLMTFCKSLCEGGLVDKGLLGEFAARTLLLIARDFTAPKLPGLGCPDLLKPVPLLDFLDELFGNTQWCGTNRDKFFDAFQYTYVNFTHWIVTKDPLPEDPDP